MLDEAPPGGLISVHPVPMRTVFRHCFLVNFAVRPDVLASRLPDHVRPDAHDGWSYLSIVIAEMERMRPAFLPRALGNSQVVYRAVVVCGRERGAYFVRSDADDALMVLAGNALTLFSIPSRGRHMVVFRGHNSFFAPTERRRSRRD